MWQVGSKVILALYMLFVAFNLLVAFTLSDDPIEFQPPSGWWMYVLVSILEVGVGLLCIYLSVRLLRRRSILLSQRRDLGRVLLGKSLIAVVALVLGWLGVFAGLRFRAHPWNLQPPFRWGIVAIVFCWMLVGFLDRQRAGADETASAGS